MTTIVAAGGNCTSVARAFERLGEPARLADTPAEIARAERLVLPGVGHFGALMFRLRQTGIADALLAAAYRGTPLLGICLGLQVLYDASDEAPGVPGLGLLPGRILRLPPAPGWRVPNVGWSEVPELGAAFYFTHSYYVPPGPHTRAATSASTLFTAVAGRGAISGVQFHPEKSGAAGSDFLRRWLAPPPAQLLRRVIACLDIAAGRVVKGRRFEALRDCGDPAALAAAHQRNGADETFLLDIAATANNRTARIDTVRRVARELSIPLGVGGGVRSLADATALLDAGADKVSVNSAAVARPALITELAAALGSQAVVVAVDANQGRVMTHAGRRDSGREVVDWAREAAARGAGEILLTSMAHDGVQHGFDCALTAAVASAVAIPVIASGGAGSAVDFIEAFTWGGAGAALAASIFHDGHATPATVKRELSAAGIAVRL